MRVLVMVLLALLQLGSLGYGNASSRGHTLPFSLLLAFSGISFGASVTAPGAKCAASAHVLTIVISRLVVSACLVGRSENDV